MAALPLPASRPVRITSAPALARASAASYPRPPVAPVMTAVLPTCEGISACVDPAMKRPAREAIRRRARRLLPYQRDLQIGGTVLLGIKAAAVNVASAPEQQIPPEIHKIVLHEIRSLLQTEGNESLSEYALG